MSYKSNNRVVNEAIDFIMTKVEKRTGIRRQLEEFLRDDANVWIYTEMPPAVKVNYDEFLKTYTSIYEFRGLCFVNQFIRAKKMSSKEMHSKVDIVIHNLFETPESLAWVMLHEFMHGYLKSENPFSGTCAAVHSMNWIWEDRVDRLHPTMNHSEYYNTDEGHELNSEEILCNLYATSLIGTNYDRHWWRKTKNKITINKEV
jgi:hypothetical protein